MNVLVLLLFAAIPPDAPPVMPPDAPPCVDVAALPDATGEPTVTVLPCQCGERCECDPCECPDCPHRAVKDSLTAQPPLVITSAISGCPPCERFKRDALPRLQAAGWVEGKDYAVRLVPLGSETVPSFAYRGELFTQGYGGWSDWRAKLVAAIGEPERVTPVNRATPVQIHHAVPRSVPPARRQWSYSGSNLAEHLRQTHGVDPTGMSHRDMVNAHSHAHEGTWNGVASGARYSQPVYSSGCPGGNCPSSSRSRGLFGGLFR